MSIVPHWVEGIAVVVVTWVVQNRFLMFANSMATMCLQLQNAPLIQIAWQMVSVTQRCAEAANVCTLVDQMDMSAESVLVLAK